MSSGDVRSLVLRAWLEPDGARLRVRIVEIPAWRSERSVLATTSIDETCGAVRAWLEALQAPDHNGNSDDSVTRKG